MNASVASDLNKDELVINGLILNIGQEAFNFSAVSGLFKQLATNVLNSLKTMTGLIDVEKIEELPKDQRKFLDLIKKIDYTSIGLTKAQNVEGSKVTYLRYMQELTPACEYAVGINAKIDRYITFLAQFVSDHKFSTSTMDDKKQLASQEKIRKDLYTEFSKLYSKDSMKAVVLVKHVVERNADWEKVFKEINPIIRLIESVDRTKLKAQIKQCSDYIEIIISDFQKNKDRKVSQEAADRLASLALDIAKDLEFYATTHFRVLQLKGCIENTTLSIRDSLE